MQNTALLLREEAAAGAALLFECREPPMHLKFPSVVDQIKAYHVYSKIKIEHVMQFAQAGNWSSAALPKGADGWLVIAAGTEHYALDAAAAKRKLSISRAFYDCTTILPEDLRRTAEAREAFFRLRQLQPFPLHIVAAKLGGAKLANVSVDERVRARRSGEYGLGVREVADALRIINRLESPIDLGIDCSADRIGPDAVPCFSIKKRVLTLSSRSTGAASPAFAEAIWFMPEK